MQQGRKWVGFSKLSFCKISVKFAEIIPEEPNISGDNAKHCSILFRSNIIIENPENTLETLNSHHQIKRIAQ